MRELLVQYVTDAAQNPKVAAAVAGGTTGTGLATTYKIIPFEYGEIATILGICLSCVLIVTHLLQHRIKMRLMKAELKKAERDND